MEPLALDPLERSYRLVLLGQRICQLYCFMLIFEPLSKLISFALEWLVWAIGALAAAGDTAQAMPVLEQLFLVRSLRDFVFVVNVWAVFTIYAAFRPAWWSIILCIIALGYNQYVAWLAIQTDPTEWVGPAGRPLPDTVLGNPLDLRDWLFQGGLAVLHLYFLAIAVLGQREIHRRDESERADLSEFAPGQLGAGSSLLALFNIPQAIRYASSKLFTGPLMILAGVANFTNFWRLTVIFLMAAFAPLLITYFLAAVAGGNPDMAVRQPSGTAIVAVVVVMAVFLGIMLLIPWLIKLLGRLATWLAKWQMRTSLETIQHRDHRPPVLFLRSFANDLVSLPDERRTLAGWLLDGMRKGVTLDYMMLEEGTRIGPCVALGNPDDPAPPYGVARGYFDHDDWKDAVRSLCKDSAAILLVLDRTEGVDWEISHIARCEFVNKALFLLAPGDVGRDRGRDLLGKALANTFGLPRDEAGRIVAEHDRDGAELQPVGFMVRDKAARLLVTGRPTQYTYLVAIRHFLRSLPGRTEASA